MSNIIILYSTVDGHTRKISLRLQEIIEKENNQVTLLPVDGGTVIDLDSFDKIIIGASIRYGRHRPQIHEFIKENLQILNTKPNAFFSVNVVARKPEKNQPDTNPYLLKFLEQITWKPRKLAVFAGKIEYQKYKFWDRLMIRLIMWITKGPTDPKTNIEFTDWSQVEDFGKTICKM